jgi:hypothetical protein
MNRERSIALFFILLGVGVFISSILLMLQWSTAYNAALEYSSVMLESSRTGATLHPLQESPPIDGGLLGTLAPVILAAVAANFFCYGLRDLGKAP